MDNTSLLMSITILVNMDVATECGICQEQWCSLLWMISMMEG